jgi:serine/threonine protein kinase/tetratricopeptide (TPR) repeat protein
MSDVPRTPKDLFLAAVEKPTPVERTAFLDEACAGDAALRRRVEALLKAHDEPGSDPAGEPLPTGGGAPDEWEDSEALPPPPPEGFNTRIGPYKLLQKLGEGGMGAVWMAEQEQPVRRRVALKIIKAGMDSRQVIARFEQERQALALMDHPNIAKVLDAGATDAGRPFFVMELVKGLPITKFCDQECLSPRERLELFIPVCQAVQHAHQKGIIHRDLKPSNVLVALYDGQPVPKVIDFGVAKATGPRLTEQTLFTEVGQIVGTLEYMAPEQAEFNNLDIDTRADIYALGVILYELLTGSTPFTRRQLSGAAFTEMLRLIREVEPPKPSTKLSNSEELSSIAARRKLEPKRLTQLVHGDLDWIVMKCLEKERGRRYETANGLALELQRYLADEPVLAGPPGIAYRLRKFLRRNKGPVVASAVVLLALVSGVVGTTWGLVEARRQRDAAEAARRDEAEQRHLAEQEAAISKAVNDFLQEDLLGQADVGNQPGGGQRRDPDVKVRTLLDRAARAVEGKFAEQPETEAAIRLTLGTTYRALGRYAEAQPHLERSVRLRTDRLGADHPDTLASKLSLAGLYYYQGKYDLAEALFKEVLAGRTAQPGADRLDILQCKHNLAALYLDQAKYEQAEPLLREVLAGHAAKLGTDHPSTLATKDVLALLYQRQAKFEQAEPLLREVLAGRTAKLGADHPDILTSKLNLAAFYQRQRKYEQAERLYREVLEASTAQLGPNHPDTLRSKNNLAVLYHIHRKYDQAEPLYQAVLDARAAQLGADHPDTLTIKNNLAGLYRDQGKYDRAEPLLKEALDGRTARLGADHPNTLTSRYSLAELYRVQGKYDDAEPLYRDVVEGARAKLGLAHPNTQGYVLGLVACCEQMGRPARGEPLLRELADFWKQKAGADSSQYAGQLALLGSNFLLQQRPADAEPVLRECLTIGQQKLPDDWTTYNTSALLGEALLGQKKYAEAEPLLLAGYEGMKQREAKIPVTSKVRLTEALERLVQLYDARGQKDKADEWRKKLEAAKAPDKK